MRVLYFKCRILVDHVLYEHAFAMDYDSNKGSDDERCRLFARWVDGILADDHGPHFTLSMMDGNLFTETAGRVAWPSAVACVIRGHALCYHEKTIIASPLLKGRVKP